MSTRPVIALLTDLGLRDAYVGMMKAVINNITSDTTLIDLTHNVAPHNVTEAAYELLVSYPYFASGSIFCCVVDPGVGSERHAIAVEIQTPENNTYYLIGPDNGTFTGAFLNNTITNATTLEAPAYQLANISSTFHGRDIFAPAAAHLARGVPLSDLGRPLNPDTLHKLEWSTPSETEEGFVGTFLHADQFGNVITNVHSRLLSPDLARWQVWLDGTRIGPIHRTFTDVRVGSPLAYVGSSGFLEIAVRDGSARNLLKIKSSSVVKVTH